MSRTTNLVRPLLVAAGATAVLASALVAGPAVATPEAVPTPASVSQAATTADELTFTAALPYDRRGLLRTARAISSPGSASYRNFLTLKEAAKRFGATPAQRAALREVASDLGMKVSFSATGLTARLTAPVTTWTEIFGRDGIAAERDPWLVLVYADTETGTYLPTPQPLASVVRVLMPEESILQPPTARAAASSRQVLASVDDTPPTNLGTPFGPGAECLFDDVVPYTYAPSQLQVPYGTAALHAQGLRGAGTRIVNIAGGYAFSREGMEFAADCFEYRAPPVRFTGGPGVGASPVFTSGDLEGELDTQTIAAVVPEATRIDYVEVAQTYVEYLALMTGAEQMMTRLSPLPDVATMSFGACERGLIGPGMDALRAVTDDHFALAGILGITVLAAAGDGGSSDCSQFVPDPPAATRVNSVQYPASSPWVTGVGGTRIVLGEGNERVAEYVWNDSPYEETADGGTGGPSLAARPWYQKPVTAADRRLVPDIAAHASTYAGWPVALRDQGLLGIAPVAGTSAASPFSAANLALIAAAERKAGRPPLGFISPLLYDLASKPRNYSTAFYDITEGSNQLYFEAGCCIATKGYDQATGLGALEFDELIRMIPRPARR
ncbi:MAG: S53 family peptidase [Candidatus Nanopelagicales bacterium]